MTTPYLPPPPRRRGWPWVVVPLVAVLVAAGVLIALLVSDGEDHGAPSSLPGRATGCTGEYCVGPHPYANACAALAPEGTWQLFPGGSHKIRVKEVFADPLPRSATNVESSCELAPLDDNAILWINLHLRQTATAVGVTVEPGTGTSRPLAAVPGAVVFVDDELADAHWVHGHISAKLSVASVRGKPPLADAELAKLVRRVDAALATPKGRPEPVPGGTRGDAKVYTDACEVFTGADFPQANPDYVQREYTDPSGYDEQDGSTCHRYTVRDDDSDVLLDPEVTVYPAPDADAAMERFADAKVQLTGAVTVSGVGDAAAFGGSSLVFVKGFHVVRINTTGADKRAELTAMATAISARMR